MKRDSFERGFSLSPTVLVELWGIEVGEPDLDPGVGIGGFADAKAVAVTDVANRTRKLHASLVRERSLARIGKRLGCETEKREAASNKEGAYAHAAFPNAPPAPLFFSMARTNLSHLAMPARFSAI